MKEHFAQQKERRRRGGVQSQINQGIARMNHPIGPRRRPSGRIKKTVIIADHDTGEVVIHDLYVAFERVDQYRVVTNGVERAKPLSATKLAAMNRRAWARVPEIEED